MNLEFNIGDTVRVKNVYLPLNAPYSIGTVRDTLYEWDNVVITVDLGNDFTYCFSPYMLEGLNENIL